MISDEERVFIASQPVARLATASGSGAPHVVPICFVVIDESLYFTIDEKPKRSTARPLKRVRNIQENPKAAVIIDRYDDEWSRLGWVMLHGEAEIIESGEEHAMAQDALKARYPQYRQMMLSTLPVVAIRIRRTTIWGNLAADA
ncbi:MAG: TIGR03668 family PPOX class F420-dependent oxidoreductase [Alphaproteobacteria bacterium]|nr:TIGR03668 family PPOX class F420-dependent oxidoreductase [Alphaproteobacteria bacterium]